MPYLHHLAHSIAHGAAGFALLTVSPMGMDVHPGLPLPYVLGAAAVAFLAVSLLHLASGAGGWIAAHL